MQCRSLKINTFRNATANIIDVTKTTSPARNEKRANIARIFRTVIQRDCFSLL